MKRFKNHLKTVCITGARDLEVHRCEANIKAEQFRHKDDEDTGNKSSEGGAIKATQLKCAAAAAGCDTNHLRARITDRIVKQTLNNDVCRK